MKKHFLVTFTFRNDKDDSKRKALRLFLEKSGYKFETEKEDQSTYYGKAKASSYNGYIEDVRLLKNKLEKFASILSKDDDDLHFFYPMYDETFPLPSLEKHIVI